MKKLMLTLVSVMALVFFVSSANAITIKVGILNLQTVVKESPQVKAMQDAIKKQFTPQEQKIASAQKSLKSTVDKFRKNVSVMTKDQRDDLQKDIVKEEHDLQQMQVKFQQKFMSERNKDMNKIYTQIKSIVSKIANKEQYDLIITHEVVAFSKSYMDITNQVVAALKKQGASTS